MRYSEKTIKEYAKIYDYYYGKFVSKLNKERVGKRPFRVSPNRQAQVIDTILGQLPYEYSNALKLMIKYQSAQSPLTTASKISSIPKKKLAKYFETATRHMYAPKNIEFAVPCYYPKPRTEEEDLAFHRLTAEDFGNCRYVLTALQKKSDIYYREQLLRHISAGWFYLWTLPGCGDGARQKILMAIDKWEGKEVKI